MRTMRTSQRRPLYERPCLGAPAGFTLVEMLIVGTVVLVLIGGSAQALSVTGRQVWLRTDSQIAGLTAAQRALDRMGEDLRQARQANLTCGANQVAFDPAPPPCYQIPCPAPPARISYSLDQNGNLLRQQGAATPEIRGSELLTFTSSCQTGVVGLQMTAQINTPNGQFTRLLTSEVRVQSP